MDQIFAKPQCAAKLFAFWMNRDLNHNALGGEMTVCGTDPVHYNVNSQVISLYSLKGPITYAPVKSKDYWRISMDGLSIVGENITGTVDAILDTGTSLITGPTEEVLKVIFSFYSIRI